MEMYDGQVQLTRSNGNGASAGVDGVGAYDRPCWPCSWSLKQSTNTSSGVINSTLKITA